MNNPLAAHLCQSTLFAAAAGLLTLAFRRNRAQVRYWLWLSASLKFLIPFAPLLGLGSYLETRMPAARVVAERIAAPAVAYTLEHFDPPLPDGPFAAPPPSPSLSWLPVALWSTWLCGFLLLALIRFHGWRRIRKLVNASAPAQLSATPSARTGVRVSAGLLEPGVIGVFHPILLLPERIGERLTPAELNAVLAHELCHIRRRDNFFVSIHMLVEAIFWFHPLVWFIGARLVEERERACDEEVLSQGNQPDVYADAILSICKLYVESPLACASGVSGGSIRRRIEAIVRNEARLKLNLARKLALVLAAAAALAVPIANGMINAPLLAAQALPIAQASNSPGLQFEVASIKPAARNVRPGAGNFSERAGIPGYCLQKFELDQAQLDVQCYSLGKLMWIWAYGITPERLAGLPWMGDASSDWSSGPKFDIAAKLPAGASRAQVPAMLQNLLASRFGLATHKEYREQTVYALTVAKGGLTVEAGSPNPGASGFDPPPPGSEPMSMNGIRFYGLRTADPAHPASQLLIMHSPSMGTVRNISSGSPKFTERFEAPDITFAGLADLLAIQGLGLGHQPVIDITGARGRYKVDLEISRADVEAISQGPHDVADIQSALADAARDGLKKLGLQLDRRKAPVEVLVVDRLQKAPAEN